jgi:hypothetical protein
MMRSVSRRDANTTNRCVRRAQGKVDVGMHALSHRGPIVGSGRFDGVGVDAGDELRLCGRSETRSDQIGGLCDGKCWDSELTVAALQDLQVCVVSR